MEKDEMSQDEEQHEEQRDSSQLTYHIGKTMKVADLRDKMKTMGINHKGPKRTLLNRIKYFTSSRKRGLHQINADAKVNRNNISSKEEADEHLIQEPPKKKRRIQTTGSDSNETKKRKVKAEKKVITKISSKSEVEQRNINDLSNDCIQMILSNLLDFSIILVCKRWNQLSKLNARFILEGHERIIEKYASYFNPKKDTLSFVHINITTSFFQICNKKHRITN